MAGCAAPVPPAVPSGERLKSDERRFSNGSPHATFFGIKDDPLQLAACKQELAHRPRQRRIGKQALRVGGQTGCRRVCRRWRKDGASLGGSEASGGSLFHALGLSLLIGRPDRRNSAQSNGLLPLGAESGIFDLV